MGARSTTNGKCSETMGVDHWLMVLNDGFGLLSILQPPMARLDQLGLLSGARVVGEQTRPPQAFPGLLQHSQAVVTLSVVGAGMGELDKDSQLRKHVIEPQRASC